ncbi:MAG TPA: potassium transporter TrkG, partial [Saprospiraceae bacterium]|nr:potassium transporter TrkG [Saprospiraceae bacterium]
GFPIVFNYYRLIRRFLMHKTREIIYKEPFPHAPRVINLNTKIVVFTTLILLIAGAVGFYFLEKDNTLQEHNTYGQIVTAFFGSVTPRTAGFNTIDMMALTFPAIMLTFFLMWVGASPASTGGGIKTTTLAVATLNIFSIVRGKQRVELSKREISNESVKQAFAVISLSLIIVGFAVFALSFTDSEKGLMRLAFEAFSAFGTVGLTLGVTPELSFVGKLIIIVTMFVGRVGLFTLLKGILPDRGYQSYKYPTESVIIT